MRIWRRGKRAWLLVVTILAFAVLMMVGVFAEKASARWLSGAITAEMEGLGITLSHDRLEFDFFRFTPSLKVEKLQLSDGDGQSLFFSEQISIKSSWRGLLSKPVRLHAISAFSPEFHYTVNENGVSNWHEKFTSILELQNEKTSVVIPDYLSARSGRLIYTNKSLDQAGRFDFSGTMSVENAVSQAEFDLTGSINQVPLEFNVTATSNYPGSSHAANIDLWLIGSLDQLKFDTKFSVSDVFTLADPQMELNIKGKDLNQLASTLYGGETAISDIALSASITTNQDGVVSGEFNTSLDNSSANGTMSINNHANPQENTEIAATISAQSLFIDQILGLDLAVSPSGAAAKKKSFAKQNLFSNRPFSTRFLFSDSQVDLSVTVDSLHSRSLAIHDLNMTFNSNANAAAVRVHSDDFASGFLDAKVSLFSDESDLKSRIHIRADGVELGELASLGNMPDGVASGKLNGDMKIWLKGESAAEMAASVDGGLFLLIEDGRLDSLFVEMATMDVMESVNLVINSDLQHTKIRCGFADIQADEGVVSFKDFIIDTTDTIFIVSGNVNLAQEKINLKVSPHPRDTSFLAVTTPVHVRGKLSSPKLRPGRKLYTRVAVAAAMATLVGPGAVVLPFFEIGKGSSESYCAELFGG